MPAIPHDVKIHILTGMLFVVCLISVLNIQYDAPLWQRALQAMPFLLFMVAGGWVWLQPAITIVDADERPTYRIRR